MSKLDSECYQTVHIATQTSYEGFLKDITKKIIWSCISKIFIFVIKKCTKSCNGIPTQLFS